MSNCGCRRNGGCGCGNRNLINALCNSVGEAVTIYTNNGECNDNGFTGIITGVNRNCVRLMACPSNPCGGCVCDGGCGCSGGCGCGNQCGNQSQGTTCYIPTNQITSFCCNS